MHGDRTVHFLILQKFFHLLVAFFVISHFDRRYSLGLQCTDVVYVNPLFCRGNCRFHGVRFPVLAAHASEGDLRPLAETSCLQAFCHLHERGGNHLFNIICHSHHPLLCHQCRSKVFHSLGNQSLDFFFGYSGCCFFLCSCVTVDYKGNAVKQVRHTS